MPFDPSYSFGSEAINLEYTMLSAMLAVQSTPKLQYLTHRSSDSYRKCWHMWTVTLPS